ncbi:UNVERIFIED_CONTAM: LINE-1 retrotransposable element O protein [Sesamum latifolium]|uniref:LINE-1 retrotransposable element O protein n=1 Tax=Sesamum latifolium TaxID=2727402 RepID=A0AAW2VYK9_9LAMI
MWADLFSKAKVVHVAVACSDHSMLLLALDGILTRSTARKKRRFRFEAVWASSSACAAVIQQAWGSTRDPAPNGVLDKTRECRLQLMQWDRECFGNIRWKTKELNDKICRMEEGVITPMVKAEVESLKDSMDKLAASEEILWKQRSKALWLAAGDRNTSFFHAKANERRLNKKIKCIKNEAGVEVKDKEEIQNVVSSYFRDIFGFIHPTIDAMEEVLGNMDRRVTDAMNDALDLPFMSEEVLNALKQMHPLKSPGPDGMSPIFYQKYWSLVGPDVCSLIAFILFGLSQ